MIFKNYPTTNKIFKLISVRSSFQKKKIENFYKKLNKKNLNEIENYLKVYNKFLNINKIKIQDAVNSYQEMCNDMFSCHIKFLRTGKYPVDSLKEAKENVYNNQKKMKSYMVGLAISQFFWETHFKMFSHLQLLIKKNSMFATNYLEIGPGHGLFSHFSLSNLTKLQEYNAIDISKTSLNLTKSFLKLKHNNKKIKKKFILGDFLNIKIKKKFDLIVCGEVIEHVYNPTKLLLKINHNLTPRGRVFISTCINCPAIDHVNQWNKIDQIRALFKISNFKIMSEKILPVEKVSYKTALKNKITVNYSVILKRYEK